MLTARQSDLSFKQKPKEETDMLDKTVAELLNTQINKEFYSAYLYLDFANYYKDAELNGFHNW